MNSVVSLLDKPFYQRSEVEKLEIKRLGPPQPDIKLKVDSVEGGKARSRRFQSSWYSKKGWLCGSEQNQKLFCFPCLCFAPRDTCAGSRWFTTGVNDWKHLSQLVKIHESSKVHLSSSLKLSMLGQVDIRTQLDSGYQLSIRRHNEEVDHNRCVLSRIIDCVKFCGFFELALRGHDERETSENPGIFRGLVDLIATADSKLANHLSDNASKVFKGTSKTVQNDLLKCMLEVITSEIRHEVSGTEFCAIISDDTTDVSCQVQNVLVLRYVQDGLVRERFYGFTKLNECNSDAIAEVILSQLEPVFPDEASKTKVIAQSYDGASVMRGRVSGVQVKVREHYPNAHFVHCYAHQLNLIMKQAVSYESRVRIFFATLHSLTNFFSHSPKRTSVLERTVGRRLPRGNETRWNFNERPVNTVYENREALIECFQSIIESAGPDSATIAAAAGNVRCLHDREFVFWLTFMRQVMARVSILYAQLQKRNVDVVSISRHVTEFQAAIGRIRAATHETAHGLPCDLDVTRSAPSLDELVAVAKSCCDVVVETARERFTFVQHLAASQLFDTAKYQSYKKKFPSELVAATKQAYPMLHKEKLSSELELIYDSPEFAECTNALSFLKLFSENNLSEVFSETKRLLGILATTPMTTSEAERCFSTLKRIKTFLRNTMAADRLNALAMLAMERNLVRRMSDFNVQVIEKFAQMKERRANFLYKKIGKN